MGDPDALITGTTIGLRAARSGDETRWFEAQTDAANLRHGLPAPVEPPAGPDDLTNRVLGSRAQRREGEPGVLMIVEGTAPDRLLGIMAWRFDVPALLGVADVGYVVHPDARGRGVATAALTLMVRWLLRDEDGPGLARVQLDHSVENPASCRVALGAGLAQEGVRRGFLPLRDPDAPGGVRRHDVCLHGLPRGT